MKTINETKAMDEGRAQQFDAMMRQLATMQARYKGVRGELLAKVREELMKLKPERSATTLSSVAPPAPTPPDKIYPSCRACGRSMKPSGADGTLVCQNGHTRLVA